MAIISSNISDNNFPSRKNELRIVESKIISEEKNNNQQILTLYNLTSNNAVAEFRKNTGKDT